MCHPARRGSKRFQEALHRLARIDLAVDIRWGIELDIHPEHRGLEGHAADARRYRDLYLVEWQIEPVSELDMLDSPTIAES